MTLAIGEQAPEFALKDETGTTRTLANYRGKWVVLYFYPRDNTPGCTKEACGFRDRYPDFSNADIQILGVSADTLAAHQKFSNKLSLPFPLLCDPDAVTAKAYGSYGPKKFMGKSYEGIFRQTFIIDPQGQLAKIYTKVKPEPHAAEVFADLVMLQQGG